MELNPYAPIRKVPLLGEGIHSSAYGVQMENDWKQDDVWLKRWNEVGVVGNTYMLLPNSEVRDAATQVTNESLINFKEDKVFFNGRTFIYSMKSDHIVGEIAEGDDIALGLQFWNSYDGSRAFGFALMLYRLVCLNGMTSRDHFTTMRFKHEPTSEGWEETLESAVKKIDAIYSGSDTLEVLLKNLTTLNRMKLTVDNLGDLRHNYLKDIPVSLWGNVVDKFINPTREEENNGWQLLNCATDLLWHRDKPTVASYDQNSRFVDGMCNYVSELRAIA